MSLSSSMLTAYCRRNGNRRTSGLILTDFQMRLEWNKCAKHHEKWPEWHIAQHLHWRTGELWKSETIGWSHTIAFTSLQVRKQWKDLTNKKNLSWFFSNGIFSCRESGLQNILGRSLWYFSVHLNIFFCFDALASVRILKLLLCKFIFISFILLCRQLCQASKTSIWTKRSLRWRWVRETGRSTFRTEQRKDSFPNQPAGCSSLTVYKALCVCVCVCVCVHTQYCVQPFSYGFKMLWVDTHTQAQFTCTVGVR